MHLDVQHLMHDPIIAHSLTNIDTAVLLEPCELTSSARKRASLTSTPVSGTPSASAEKSPISFSRRQRPTARTRTQGVRRMATLLGITATAPAKSTSSHSRMRSGCAAVARAPTGVAEVSARGPTKRDLARCARPSPCWTKVILQPLSASRSYTNSPISLKVLLRYHGTLEALQTHARQVLTSEPALSFLTIAVVLGPRPLISIAIH